MPTNLLKLENATNLRRTLCIIIFSRYICATRKSSDNGSGLITVLENKINEQKSKVLQI